MKKLYCVFILIVAGINVRSQDIHFSQFDQNPMILNPAYAGMYDGTFRFNLNYKNQWAALGNVFETYSASTDYIIFKNSMGMKSTGLGVSAYQDVAGSSRTKTTRVDLNLSQTIYLNMNADLTLGVGFSYLDMSANFNGLNWGSQYDGVEFDQSIGSGEAFSGYAEKGFDLSAGMLFRWYDNGLDPFELGVSTSHLARPQFTILSQEDNIPVRVNIHVLKEYTFPNFNNWGVKGVGYFSSQRTAKELVIGGFMRRDFGMVSKYTGYYKNVNFYFGAYYRVGDAFIPSFLLTVHRKISFGMSYDFTVSQLSNTNSFRGGPELSFSYIGPFKPVVVISPKNFD